MRRLAIVLAALVPFVAATPVLAKGDPKKAAAKKAAAAKDKDDDDDKSDDDDDKKKPPAKDDDKKADASEKKVDKKADDDDDDSDDNGGGGGFTSGKKIKVKDTGEAPLVKQDLNGHDMGTRKKTTEFERDRFFVDKTDTEETADKTLVQGSITSSSFLFKEMSGGTFAKANGAFAAVSGNNNSDISRLWTDLRLQTDFRHIGGGRWDARIDGRIRAVSAADQVDEKAATTTMGTAPTPIIQGAALDGGNEYDLRELWLIRNGVRTDVTIGRQFITDLAAVKIDGLRIDYAQSSKFTYVGFAGLYPFRGSRSLSTDYIQLKNPADGTDAGKFIGTGGFGAAYRTPTAYGAFGGVAQQAIDGGDQTRIFGTANGYWRVNPTLDIYHFAVVDLIQTQGNAQLTNLSAGVNYKPSGRLRLTASFNRNDTETLAIQAGAYLDQPRSNLAVQNEIFLSRLATNEARGSISAGLGNLNRFEITVAATYRNRPGFTLDPLATGIAAAGAQSLKLPIEKGYEVFGSILDRHSYKDMRLGIDGYQSFTVGDVPSQHSNVLALRAFAGRDLDSGRGEWEAEVAYSSYKDIINATTDVDTATTCATPDSCFGQTSGTVISLGGTIYYRINHSWFLIGQLWLSQQSTTVKADVGAAVDDPSITDLSGYFRIAYRF